MRNFGRAREADRPVRIGAILQRTRWRPVAQWVRADSACCRRVEAARHLSGLVHSCPICRCARLALLGSLSVFLAGCWVPPSANVRPAGPARVIARGLAAQWSVQSAAVESLNSAAGTLTLRVHGIALPACDARRAVHRWASIRPGLGLRTTLRVRLDVYVAPIGQRRPESGSAFSIAHVLQVWPSYRILTLQFPDGGRATLKMGLHADLAGVGSGDAVVIHCIRVIEVHAARDPVSREESSHSRRRAAWER